MKIYKILITLVIGLFFTVSVSHAQLNGTFRQLRLKTVFAAADTAATSANRGNIWHDKTTFRFRANENGSNVNVITSASGAALYWKLAGTSNLTANTSIANPTGYNLTIGGPAGTTGITGSAITLTNGNNTMSFVTSGTGIFSFNNYIRASPNGTNPGVGVGITTGDPSTTQRGDLWYRTTGAETIRANVNGAVTNLISGSTTATRLLYGAGGTADVTNDADLTWTAANNQLNVGRLFATTTTTDAGINVGSFAGNPSVPVNNDIWVNSSTNRMMARVNGANVVLDNDATAVSAPVALSAASVPVATGAATIANSTLTISGGQMSWVPGAVATFSGIGTGNAWTIEGFNATAGTGTTLTLKGGSNLSGVGTPGNIVVTGGTQSGTGIGANVTLTPTTGTTNGSLIMQNIPTTDPSVTDAVWNNNGILVKGAGAPLLYGSATLDFPSTVSTAVADLTITVTGATAGKPCNVGPPNGSVTATATFTCWVSSANTITVRFSPKATEDPASGTFSVVVHNK